MKSDNFDAADIHVRARLNSVRNPRSDMEFAVGWYGAEADVMIPCFASSSFMPLLRYTVAESECRIVLLATIGTDRISLFIAQTYCLSALTTCDRSEMDDVQNKFVPL